MTLSRRHLWELHWSQWIKSELNKRKTIVKIMLYDVSKIIIWYYSLCSYNVRPIMLLRWVSMYQVPFYWTSWRLWDCCINGYWKFSGRHKIKGACDWQVIKNWQQSFTDVFFHHWLKRLSVQAVVAVAADAVVTDAADATTTTIAPAVVGVTAVSFTAAVIIVDSTAAVATVVSTFDSDVF